MANFDNRILNLKQILEEKYCQEITLDQAREAYRTLESVASISLQVAEEEVRRRNLLKEIPTGFHYDRDGCSCRICQRVTHGLESWYDKNGLKCLTCQHALNQKIVPASVAKDKNSWYSDSDLEGYFNIGKKELNKYIKSGFLKNRTILTAAKKVASSTFSSEG